MKETRILMGMPITIEILDSHANQKAIDTIFEYFASIDRRFSTYKDTSEIMQINRGEINEDAYSSDMQEVLRLCAETKKQTNGYFDIKNPKGILDPSGLVKGWSVYHAAEILTHDGFQEFYVDAGGDIEARGRAWKIGIKNPFNQSEIIKVVSLKNCGIATSGIYIRGPHIYNPHGNKPAYEVASVSVIGPNVYEADRFATAAFAMGEKGISFIKHLDGLEGYIIDKSGIATMTSGFEKFVHEEVII